MNTLNYVGEELDLFAHAHHWKSYWASRLRPCIRGDVLENLGVIHSRIASRTCTCFGDCVLDLWLRGELAQL